MREEQYYQIFKKQANKDPLKASLVIRFLYIPQLYKNLTLCVLDINFKDYYYPAIGHYFPYLALPILIGHNIKSLRAFFHQGHIRNSSVMFSMLGVALLFLISLGLFAYLVYFAYTQMQLFKNDFNKGLTQTHQAPSKLSNQNKNEDTLSRAESSQILNMDS